MRRDEYILLLTKGLLQTEDNKYIKLVEFVQSRFEIEEPRKINSVSIGVITKDGKDQSLLSWITKCRKEKFSRISITKLNYSDNLDPHIANAYVGGQNLILSVEAGEKRCDYILQTSFSPQYQMKVHEFSELVESQKDPNLNWESIESLIQQSNKLNNHPLIEKGSVKTYLNSKAGAESYERQLSDFVKELQINASITNVDFVIPASKSHLLEKFTFPKYGGNSRDIVYLYPESQINSEHLLTLVQAQPFAAQVWIKAEEYYKNNSTDSSSQYSASEWPSAIMKMQEDEISNLSYIICRLICEICEENKLEPIIPHSIKENFGPNEFELKRIKAREFLNDNQLYLTINKDPWEFYFYEEIESPIVIDSTIDQLDIEQEFYSQINEIEKFATRINSAFAETFRLVKFLLEKKNLPDVIDERYLATIKEQLIERNFSDRAIEFFLNQFYFNEELQLMNWTVREIHLFWAVSLADVFGGMGSWNDQYLENSEDYELYQKLSEKMYSALKNFYMVSLNSFGK